MLEELSQNVTKDNYYLILKMSNGLVEGIILSYRLFSC